METTQAMVKLEKEMLYIVQLYPQTSRLGAKYVGEVDGKYLFRGLGSKESDIIALVDMRDAEMLTDVRISHKEVSSIPVVHGNLEEIKSRVGDVSQLTKILKALEENK